MSNLGRSTIVICLGDDQVADDAAGFEVFRRLSDLDARVEYLPAAGVDVVQLLEEASYLLVVDSVHFGYPPGTLHCIDWDDVPEDYSIISAHCLDLRDAIEAHRTRYPHRVPYQITLLGIEGICFDRPREFMTRQVCEAIEPAVAIVRGIVGGNR